MNATKIEWAKNPDGTQGYTWNPITGCLNHIDGLCKGGNFPCYAYRLAHTRLKDRYLANDNIANPMRTGRRDDIEEEAMDILNDPFYPRFWPERLDEVYKELHYNNKPRGIFTCDMSDLFGTGVPDEWTKQILWAITNRPHHRFYLLTKQPQNLIKFSPFPDNCWVGVTATGHEMYRTALYWLCQLESKVKYLSFEPLLHRLDVKGYGFETINWVIIGAQTRPTVMPRIEWVREIVEACDKARIPVFIKNNLFPLFRDEMNYLNKNWLRQEMPELEVK